MATNSVPKGIGDLLTLAEDAADGAGQYGVAIGLKQNDETVMRAVLATTRAARDAFRAAQTTKQSLYAAQKSADDNARAFIGLASKLLGNFLGSQWSMGWSETGFPNQSTAVPKSIGERLDLLASLQTYFTNHPTHANAPLNVTAAQAGLLFTALSDARSAVHAGLADAGQKKAAQEATAGVLRKRLRALIDELTLLLADDDPRWMSFGFNMPAADVTPEGPTDLVLTALPNEMVNADWADVPNADHYRVHVATGAGATNFVAEPTTFADSDATLGPYSPGLTIRVKVAAVSGGLEGPASDVAELTLAGSGGGGGGGGNGGGGGSGLPAAPGAPMLTYLGNGQVQLTWTLVAGALSFKIYQQTGDVNQPWVEVGAAMAGPATLTGLPPGATIRVRLTALNANGEGPPGPHAEITLPAPPP